MSDEIKAGYAADDYAGIHFIDGEFFRAVSGRPYAKAYKCEKINGQLIVQKRLKTKWLGMSEYQQEFVFGKALLCSKEIRKIYVESEDITIENMIRITINKY